MFRCRSAFKLIEIDDRFKFLRPGQVVVDCGAAPGSWTQVVVDRINAKTSTQSLVIAIDRQPMLPIEV
jgi:23S rRNA (uridine2552-2'-O)-methyltransferase